MDISKSVHKLPDSVSQRPSGGLAKGAAEVAAQAAAQEIHHASAESHHPVAESHEAQHAEAADTVQPICPGHGKPTIIDLFPGDESITAQTLRYPENGEPMPKEPIAAQTLRYPENGEPLPKEPIGAQTLRYPENGEPMPKLPKFPIDEFPIEKRPFPFGQTKALGENGEPIDKLPKFPKHEFPIEKRPFPGGQTKAIGENGEFDKLKPRTAAMLGESGESWGKLQPRTAAMGEDGSDLKPFKPGKPFNPFDGGPKGRTLAFPESGEDWKKLPFNPKDGVSPPCKCIPDPGDFEFMRTTAFGMGENGDDNRQELPKLPPNLA